MLLRLLPRVTASVAVSVTASLAASVTASVAVSVSVSEAYTLAEPIIVMVDTLIMIARAFTILFFMLLLLLDPDTDLYGLTS